MQQQEQHSAPNMVDDWTKLLDVVDIINDRSDGPIFINEDVRDIIVEYVPRLMDRYNELLELSHVMTSAWEKLNASKNDLYVPDAEEMVQSAGLKDRP